MFDIHFLHKTSLRENHDDVISGQTTAELIIAFVLCSHQMDFLLLDVN